MKLLLSALLAVFAVGCGAPKITCHRDSDCAAGQQCDNSSLYCVPATGGGSGTGGGDATGGGSATGGGGGSATGGGGGSVANNWDVMSWDVGNWQ